MWPDRILNPGPLALESDVLSTVLRSGLKEIVMNLSVCIFYTLGENVII